jgi:hypothetical protein
VQSPRGRSEVARIDTLERAWSNEKRGLQLEIDRLKDRLKIAENQTSRDVTVIATLEERLKDSISGSTNLDDIDGEDLNDEMNTSRRNLSVSL